MTMLDGFFVPLHRDGWRFVAAFAAGALVLWLIDARLGAAGVVAAVWCAYFFRDPPRAVPVRAGLVVSPADGRVQAIAAVAPPAELGLDPAPRTRVSIFLNVFNVHVNRIPIEGTVGALVYRPGKFFNAALDKASTDNERQSIRLDLADGRSIAVVQIAGFVARRIRCDLAVGEAVDTGERFGLIRFGSRIDVYLPPGIAPLVGVGQIAVAGETVIADLEGIELARVVEIR
jgi:phosphatidylserine decarboxylase